MERLVERVFGWVFAMLGVECSTKFIANVLVWKCSVRCAHVKGRWRCVLKAPGLQCAIHSFDKRFALMVFVVEVVIGHSNRKVPFLSRNQYSEVA